MSGQKNEPLQVSEEMAEHMASLAKRSQDMIADFMSRQPANINPDPMNLGPSLMEMSALMWSDPSKLVESQFSLWQDYMRLWQNATLRMLGDEPEPLVSEPKGDRRFKDPEWRDNIVFDFLRQGYLLTANNIVQTVSDIEGLSGKERAKVDFAIKQFVDAMSPSNFVMTNPEVLRTTLEERGENLMRGLENIIVDFERGEGKLATRMTDESAFEVGGNVAITPGKVVFQNRMLQLLQYAPTTQQVYEKPLLFLPPWINKFYILDLTAQKSMIKWLVDKGFTVFCVSWVNPDGDYRDVSFETYMTEGALEAMRAAREICGTDSVNAVGYCIAGTLLSSTLAYLTDKGREKEVNAATFFTAQVDFEEAGELLVFVDEEQIENINSIMEEKGYLDGQNMAQTFNMLRSNDLIWSFVVNNYLLGKDPFPFDLLYWNSDATRLPQAMHQFYLRNMYQDNKLIRPGEIVLDGVPIDLRSVKTDMYIQAGKDDHIAPARSVFKMLHTFSGNMRFVLAGSGHIAGVVNPPAAKKYMHWTSTKKKAADLDAWMETAKEHPGSWWEDWERWLSRRSGKKVKARVPGETKKFPAIEDAPGSYVKVKSMKS
ncbi:MAG: class I poly(R)-hydroxyalkanoic acid synthase [Pseudomonadota bacterium]